MTPELVERAQAGDPDAFTRLIETRLDRMYRLALAILGHEADARDAVQEAMTSTGRDLPALRDPARFEIWSERILVNACRLIIRRRARSRVREVAIAGDGDAAMRPLAPPDARTAAQDELERAFDRLTVDERALLVMHHLDGRSVTEIGAVLEIPVGTAKSRLHHARQSLRQALDLERR